MEQHPMGWDAWGEPLCVPPTQGTFSVHRFGVKHPQKAPRGGGTPSSHGAALCLWNARGRCAVSGPQSSACNGSLRTADAIWVKNKDEKGKRRVKKGKIRIKKGKTRIKRVKQG